MIMLATTETIAAKATPAGKGGVGIIRISGPQTANIAVAILGSLPKPRFATYCDFVDEQGHPIDQGLALYFKKPHSFTGEDVLELHGHGGPVVLDLLLQRVLQFGVRIARPGEFSERAFLNDKIDLTQAEAIADLIEASSTQAARSAINSLQGKFSEEVRQLVNQVTLLRMYVEAAIDFPDEEIDFLSDGKILEDLNTLKAQLRITLDRTTQGTAINEGLKIVIVGYPNAGKSSLLNCLSGEETAIVSEIAGTTRDIIKESILIDGVPLKIIDTAGIRASSDSIEAEGVRRALKEIPNADRILLVIDATDPLSENIGEHPLVQELGEHQDRLIIIRNKIDLDPAIKSRDDVDLDADLNIINISAKTGFGIDALKEYLKSCAGLGSQETTYIARRRHIDALNRADKHFDNALTQLVDQQAGELVAEELREAQNVLSEITGEFRPDDLLGKIFSSFCIGK